MLGVIARERERKKLCCAPHAALSLSLSAAASRRPFLVNLQKEMKREWRVESGEWRSLSQFAEYDVESE